MLILTEKPSVAKDFAKALGCHFSKGFYQSEKTIITNCIGHLFKLYEPSEYDSSYKDWNKLPIIPDKFLYKISDNVKAQAQLIIRLLKEHKNDSILIATDADREGEIIARECLNYAGINDFNKIKRFWVSQALTQEVIIEGIKNAKSLTSYDLLSLQGFARQHSDWLVGINFSRFITINSNKKLPIGRVQTAVLSAIEKLCNEVQNFIPEKYYEYHGTFSDNEKTFTGILYLNDINKFFPEKLERNVALELEKINNLINNKAELKETKTEKKTIPAPQLYSLNELQKEAFNKYNLSAAETLNIVQKLYEDYKCVSYPRTPSRVMGEQNVELCLKVFEKLKNADSTLEELYKESYITRQNKRVFNDKLLEAHHALIPLDVLPDMANEKEKWIYNLIKNRFTIAFLEACIKNINTFTLSVKDKTFIVKTSETIQEGWKKYIQKDSENTEEEFQEINNINWNQVILKDIQKKEKFTKPKKLFTEASILSFMENPKDDINQEKLSGLGTPATRHTFIPKLQNAGYIKIEKKNILITELGLTLLEAVRTSSISAIADISTTTDWEQKLNDDPKEFMNNIKVYVKDSIKKNIKLDIKLSSSGIVCPICGKEVRKGKLNYYCLGYKEGCLFNIWQKISGANITEKDIKDLCEGKKTGIKHCINKNGNNFDCRFKLDDNKKIEFIFEKKK